MTRLLRAGGIAVGILLTASGFALIVVGRGVGFIILTVGFLIAATCIEGALD